MLGGVTEPPAPDWAVLPGAPESALAAGLLARLPPATPPPPWPTRVEAVLWWHAAGPEALAALPPELGARPRRPLVVGAFLRYLDSPVGAYEEVLGAVAHAPAHVTVPFMAVDSLPSVHGGRAWWSLPKALAAFERTGDSVLARGAGWQVAATARQVGPRLPAFGGLRLTQLDATGAARRARATAVGRVRLARVDVTVTSGAWAVPGSIAGWLRPGRHRGLVLRARVRVGAPAGPPGS